MRKVDAKVRHVLIVGHDPGMQGLALELSGSGEAQSLQALAAKFPTAGLAVIGFKARDWSKVGRGKGRLEPFVTPEDAGVTTAGRHDWARRLDLGRKAPVNLTHAGPDR